MHTVKLLNVGVAAGFLPDVDLPDESLLKHQNAVIKVLSH